MISNEELLEELRKVNEDLAERERGMQDPRLRRRHLITILRGRNVSDRGLSLALGKPPTWVGAVFKKGDEVLLAPKVPVSALAKELLVPVADLREWFPLDLPRGVTMITEPTAQMIRDAVSGGRS